MVVAVTGHSGFIGKYLCKAILDRGWTLIKVNKSFDAVNCDRIYHLACPSSTHKINADPIDVIDTIVDGTRSAMAICPDAIFVNASSIGAKYIDEPGPQGGYNSAKRLMEIYLSLSDIEFVNYRLPSVYGDGMSKDSFIQRCIDGNAYRPKTPNKMHYIGHIDNIVSSMIEMSPLKVEEISLGDIYERFLSSHI